VKSCFTYLALGTASPPTGEQLAITCATERHQPLGTLTTHHCINAQTQYCVPGPSLDIAPRKQLGSPWTACAPLGAYCILRLVAPNTYSSRSHLHMKARCRSSPLLAAASILKGFTSMHSSQSRRAPDRRSPALADRSDKEQQPKPK
jgi:hypothetical protein